MPEIEKGCEGKDVKTSYFVLFMDMLCSDTKSNPYHIQKKEIQSFSVRITDKEQVKKTRDFLIINRFRLLQNFRGNLIDFDKMKNKIL